MQVAVNATSYSYSDGFNPAEIPGNATSILVDDHPVNALMSGVFAHLSHLMYLSFVNTNISTIEPGAWFGLDRLENLQLYQNELTVLSDGMFSHLPSLQQLSLDRNKITLIYPEVFTNLSSLTNLVLIGNRIKTLQNDTFVYLTKLQSLYLDQNGITVIEDGAFNGLHSLSRLSLAHNNLNSSIFTVPNVFANVTDTLVDININNNDIDKIYNDMFVGFTLLEELGLSLTYIEADGFRDLDSLKTLWLYGINFNERRTNLWTHIADTLMELEFWYADIKTLTENMFAGTPLLRELGMVHCGVTTIHSGAFNALNYIENIHIYYNRITELASGVFSGLHSLKYLSLAKNKISTIESGTFQGLSALESLWLGDNLLTTLEWTVFDTSCTGRLSQFSSQSLGKCWQ